MPENKPPKDTRTFEEMAPDPDKTPGPAGRRVMLLGSLFVAVLATIISLFALAFAPKTVGTPTPFYTPTDKILGIYQTETPTPINVRAPLIESSPTTAG